jgi:hypothetical protein
MNDEENRLIEELKVLTSKGDFDIDSYDWLHMLKASVAIKSDLPQK